MLLLLCLASACAGLRAQKDDGGQDPGPVITRLEPSSGRAGSAYPIRMVVEGEGFAPTGNVVTFDGIEISDLPSSGEGTRITVWVPKEAPSTGEAPPMELSPGRYSVTVTTPGGTSAPALFTLTPGT